VPYSDKGSLSLCVLDLGAMIESIRFEELEKRWKQHMPDG
jgi:hypothetical protein